MTPCILAGLGLIIPAISYFSTISVALYYGLMIAMMTVEKEARQIGIHEGTKYTGLIVLDLSGAGAPGEVIVAG
ncbi:hypothetical protein [Methanospirillum sp.]|uniref:hypothetical protein n=1 Tax=Methanospirillum sp. TaxID=45200 RepID=UPI002C68375A|nr:hypothetical protein [Methanospirillum sp.]HPP76839.1 hypothetical protein [Methanospirillum sp.]